VNRGFVFRFGVAGILFSAFLVGCNSPNLDVTQMVENGLTQVTEVEMATAPESIWDEQTLEPTSVTNQQPPYPEEQSSLIREFRLYNEDEEITVQPEYEIYGVAPRETVISINDDIVIVGRDEKFSKWVTLELGSNLIEIVASDLDGNVTEIMLTIFYEP
jgi:hypothetical protein